MSFCLVLASLIGPILGGALAKDSAWKWVFLIKYVDMQQFVEFYTDVINTYSVPLCAIAIVILAIAMPTNFGLDQHTPSLRTRASYRSFANLDLVGSLLLLSGTFLTISVLNEVNLAFTWSSPSAIALLVLAGISWVGFFAWEWHLSDFPKQDPIFPKRWLFDRAWIGILM